MQSNNPLLCNPESGVCEMPGVTSQVSTTSMQSDIKPVKIIYYTDPICSTCWGIEPQLRKLKLEYGNDIEVEYHMGGLLPDWSYTSGGISKPSDVAHHWDQVSQYYQMPIDGDVWLKDPLDSSYPPSIAFKSAQIQDQHKAIAFLRILREMVFLLKKNIARWEIIEQAAQKSELDVIRLRQDCEGKGKELFEEDLTLARQMGVRGFPSVFITNSQGDSEFIYGFKPYEIYEQGLIKIYSIVAKLQYSKDYVSLFEKYPTLTTKEFAELSGISFQEAEQNLEKRIQENTLIRLATKNGSLWIKK